MEYIALVDKVNGDSFAAADWNKIADNFEAGVPDLFTAAGDLAIASGANAAGVLPIGTTGQVLTGDTAQALKMKWANGHGGAFARYKVNSTTAVSAGATTIINYGASVLDPGSAVTVGASWKYTVPAGKGGYFFVVATALIQSTNGWGNTEATLRLYKGGAFQSVMGGQWGQNTSNTFSVFLKGTWFGPLNAGEYIDVRLYNNTSGTKTVDSDGNYGHITVVRLFE